MENNIKNTKKKLSLLFSVIVFVVILIIGASFFTNRFFHSYNIEKNIIKSYINIVGETGNFRTIENMSKRSENMVFKKFGGKRKNDEDDFRRGPINFINYINLDKNNKILSSNIRENIDVEEIEYVLKKDDFSKIYKRDGFFIKKFKSKGGGSFIIFKKIIYDIDDYFGDIFDFIILSLIFSALLYFISNKFVNKIFVPVEQNIDDMKNFIHNAGHELKTPISVIDSNLQLLGDTKKFDKSMNSEMRSEVKKLNSLIDSLVNLSDIDSFKNTEKNNLKDILDEILKDFKDKIKDKKLKTKIDIPEDLKVYANRDYLYIFLSNIIGNAIKYNKNKGSVDISYKSGELIIKDSGIGMSKDELKHIFDRFYKTDKSRNSEGFGIGLSLVKKIALIYKWKIDAFSVEGEGSEFKVKF